MGKKTALNGEEYINLGLILKRNRSEENEKMVRDILNQDIPVEKKILEIERIDKRARERQIRKRYYTFLEKSTDPRIRSNLKRIQNETKYGFPIVEKDYSLTYILLIDDLTYITKTVSYVLQKEGFKVYTSRNGIEGIINFQKVLPDVVITDIRLPDFNGFEIATLMRKINEEIPIIFITAINVDKKSFDLIEGKKAYLQKPIKREVLLETISRLLREDEKNT